MGDHLLYAIALTRVPGIGAVQAKILLEHLGSPKGIFEAPKKNLEKIEGIGIIRAHAIKSFADFTTAEHELAFIEKYKIQPIVLNDPAYPKRLLQCYDPPTLLFYRGNTSLNAERIVSIIGTRNHTEYGKLQTELLVNDLRDHNIVVVSGLAYGIDAIAHKSCVQHNIPTIGVLAHGLNKIYPSQHTSLAKQMIVNGGILTEFGMNTKPDRHNFPRRNRIVAGMTDCTIVVETAARGGSMITAELANGYNRDVFALPGRTIDPKSSGCNYLIKNNKAILLENADQLLEIMGWKPAKQRRKQQKELFVELTPDEQVIMEILKEKDSVHIDEIYQKCGLSSSSVAAAMLNLEFQNIVSSLPGKLYKLL